MLGCIVPIAVLFVSAADEPQQQPSSPDVVFIAKDLKQLLEGTPDAVVLTGDEKRRYLEGGTRPGGRAADASVLECRISGEVRGELAHVSVRVVVESNSDGPVTVPLRLGETRLLTSATRDGQPARLDWNEQGLVGRIDGKGQHTFVIDLLVPPAGSRTLPSLACSIPTALVATLQLKLPRDASDVRLVPHAPVDVRAAEGGVQVEATLGPRNRLDLRWRSDGAVGAETEPPLWAVSDVTAIVEANVIQVKTDLRVQVLRGARQQCELRAAAGERIVQIVRTADGTPVDFEVRPEQGEQRITVHFPTPVTGTVLTILSEVPGDQDTRVLRGVTLAGALSHRSQIAVRSPAELDVAATAWANARPADAASSPRPARDEIAFAAYGQPFQLTLSVLKRQPLTTVRTTALIVPGEDVATVYLQWQFSVRGGRLNQVAFVLPPRFQGADFITTESVQPARLEESPDRRIARVHLRGTAGDFDVQLRATVPIVAARNLVKLEMPSPLDARSEISRVYLASPKHTVLEPTGELEPSEVPLDDAILGRELPSQGFSVRGFEIGSLLDRVAFSLSRQVARVRHRTTAHIAVEPSHATVTQSFEYTVRDGQLRQFRFAAPDSVRDTVELDSPQARVQSPSSPGELAIELDGELPDPVRLTFHYRVPLALQTGQRERVELPLLRAIDGSCEATDVSIAAPWTLDVATEGDDWLPVPSLPPADEPGEAARLALRQYRQVDAVTVSVAAAKLAPQPGIVADRAWIETRVETTGEWRTSARFAISTLNVPRLRLRCPDGRITQVRWNGDALVTQETGAGGETAVFPRTGALPAVLEIESRGRLARGLRPWGMHVFEAPLPAGDVAWGTVQWQVSLPDQFVVLRGPSDYSDENTWQWSWPGLPGSTLRQQPRHDAANLQRWLTAGTPTTRWSTSAPGESVLHSRQLAVKPLTLAIVRRDLLVLASSGLALLLGILFVSSPLRGKPALSLLLVAAGAALAVIEPTAAVHIAQSAVLGVAIVLLVAASLRWALRRRRPEKRTVFPEPRMLAKQESSVRRRAEPSPPLALPQDPALPSTGSAPRLAGQSSSVR